MEQNTLASALEKFFYSNYCYWATFILFKFIRQYSLKIPIFGSKVLPEDRILRNKNNAFKSNDLIGLKTQGDWNILYLEHTMYNSQTNKENPMWVKKTLQNLIRRLLKTKPNKIIAIQNKSW